MHILWLKTELLHPVDKGGRIRTYQMLRMLARMHRVTYLTLDNGLAAPDAVERAREYAHRVVTIPWRPVRKESPRIVVDLFRNLFSSLPWTIARCRSDAMTAALREIVATDPPAVVICDFLHPSLNVPDDLGVPVVLFQHNVESVIWERMVAAPQHPVRRAYLTSQWKRLAAFERREVNRFSRVICVSEEDAATHRTLYGLGDPRWVPTGVDIDFFRPSSTRRADPTRLVFTGSMDWLPNMDAMHWFVDEVLPLIRAAVPDVTFDLVGRDPPADIRALGTRPGVRVTGSVPDVRPYLENASVFVVPIRIGGGTRLKIFEGMAMEVPVVSTTIGAEGLDVQHERDCLLADDAKSFAAAVVRVMRDRALADRLCETAGARVRSLFSWEGVAERFVAELPASVAAEEAISC